MTNCGVICTEWTFGNCWLDQQDSRASRARLAGKSGTGEAGAMAHLVYLVCLVYLVSFVQPNKPDRPNRPNEQGWLEQIADQLHRLFRRGSGMDEMRREIFEQAHPGFVGPQQNHGLLCLQCQCNF